MLSRRRRVSNWMKWLERTRTERSTDRSQASEANELIAGHQEGWNEAKRRGRTLLLVVYRGSCEDKEKVDNGPSHAGDAPRAWITATPKPPHYTLSMHGIQIHPTQCRTDICRDKCIYRLYYKNSTDNVNGIHIQYLTVVGIESDNAAYHFTMTNKMSALKLGRVP